MSSNDKQQPKWVERGKNVTKNTVFLSIPGKGYIIKTLIKSGENSIFLANLMGQISSCNQQQIDFTMASLIESAVQEFMGWN